MNRPMLTAIMLISLVGLCACNATQQSETPPGTPVPPPLAEPGAYFTGDREFTFVDESRGGREIPVTLYYPALEQADANGRHVPHNAPADMSAAPYPLILTESSSGTFIFKSHLASHGFVTARIKVPDQKEYINWDVNMLDWPRDFLFVLEQIATAPLEGLDGVIDSQQVGVSGYSWGGDITLALSGVRIDPAAYQEYCARTPTNASDSDGVELQHEVTCSLADNWDAFADFAGDTITSGADGLWQPMSDARIRAVMPMAGSGTWLYGERGLAAADRPVLMVAAAEDEFIPYQEDTAFLFEHLGAEPKSLVTFVDRDHMMIEDSYPVAMLKHLATAFFGYHLQGREDYADYFSQDFIEQYADLYWGVYPGD